MWVPPFAGSGPLMNAARALAASLAIVVGIRRHRPASRGRLDVARASGRSCSASATSTRTATRSCSTTRCRSRRSATRSTSLVYPALMAGLLLLVRRRNAAAATAPASIDALIITVGAGAALLDLPDRALHARRPTLSPLAQGGLGRLPARATSCCSPRRSAWPSTAAAAQPAFYLLSREHRAAAGHRRRLRRCAADGTYDHQLISTSAGSATTCCWARRRCTRRCASLVEPTPDRERRLTPHAARRC